MMPVLQKGAESMIKKPRSYPLTMGQAYGGKIGSVEQKISTPFLQDKSVRKLGHVPSGNSQLKLLTRQ